MQTSFNPTLNLEATRQAMTRNCGNQNPKPLIKITKTRFDVYETLCPKQMLVHKGGQIKNWSGECKDIIPTKLQCQTMQRTLQSPNLQREII